MTSNQESDAIAYVLIVEDELPVRQFLRRWLEGWGYRVREAAAATDALEIMLEEPAAIMLVDIRMPGHDGLWLTERVHARWPGTAVIIIMSGIDDLLRRAGNATKSDNPEGS